MRLRCVGLERRPTRATPELLSDIGLAAYKSGDYATALRLLRPPADKGFVKPQFYLRTVHDGSDPAYRRNSTT
jgi:hypothetical protein